MLFDVSRIPVWLESMIGTHASFDVALYGHARADGFGSDFVFAACLYRVPCVAKNDGETCRDCDFCYCFYYFCDHGAASDGVVHPVAHYVLPLRTRLCA